MNKQRDRVISINPFDESSVNSAFDTNAEDVWGSEPNTREELVMTSVQPMDFAEEVEDSSKTSVKILVLWGENVLHVRHLDPPRDFYVGESESHHVTCDVLVPEEKLGMSRAPLIVMVDGLPHAVILPGASGWVHEPGRGTSSVRDLIEDGVARPCSRVRGAHLVPLSFGVKAHIRLAGAQPLVFELSSVAAGKRPRAGLLTDRDSATPAFVAMSALVHVGLLSAMALFMPNMALLADESAQQDNLYLMQQYMKAAAERETAQREEAPDANHDDQRTHNGGTGTRAAGEEGQMGSPTSHATNKRFQVEGPKDNPTPVIARERALQEARNWGMIGVLNGTVGGALNAPTAPWGEDEALGNDPLSARGNMWGDAPGEAYGNGGLGLSGVGESGGGRGIGIGLGQIGTIGHAAGTGIGQGFGGSHGRLHRGHHPKRFRLRMGTTIANGRLPPEVIQRVVRQNYGRFRMCYERGLRSDPNLQGRVTVRFVIGRDGAVSQVSDSGSDLPSSEVVQCVKRAYYGLSFPSPDSGIVTVVYPISFFPG